MWSIQPYVQILRRPSIRFPTAAKGKIKFAGNYTDLVCIRANGILWVLFLQSLKLAATLQDESVTSHHEDSRKKSFLLCSSVRCNRIDCITPDAVISERKDWDHWQLRLQFSGKRLKGKIWWKILMDRDLPVCKASLHQVSIELGGWFEAFENRENTSQLFR